jgi:hypothetical protein
MEHRISFSTMKGLLLQLFIKGRAKFSESWCLNPRGPVNEKP